MELYVVYAQGPPGLWIMSLDHAGPSIQWEFLPRGQVLGVKITLRLFIIKVYLQQDFTY